MEPSDTTFLGNLSLPEEVKALETPIQFFKYFITDEICQHIRDQSMLYAHQTAPNNNFTVDCKQIEQFMGMCLMMSIVQLPSSRHYWNEYLGHPKISDVMTCNQWEETKRFLHFNDNTTQIPRGQPGHDVAHKIRPFLDQIRERLPTIPKEEYMAVDEQIIPTKSRSTIKQYNPKKTHKWGYKNFVLSGTSGFSYDFELYTGAKNPSDDPQVGNEPNISASSNVVVRLSRTIPEYVNHKLFF